MKRFLITALLFFTLLGSVRFVSAADPAATSHRYATCDLCGYCVTSQDPSSWPDPPKSWAKCQKCLYPSAYPVDPAVTPDARQGNTLVVDEETNLPPVPQPGTHYTVFGCIKTNIGDFTQTGAASSLVQVLLNLIFTTAGGVAVLYIVYGAFLIITSQADPERLAYGRRVVMGSIIGLVFVLMSVLIVNLLANGILTLPGFGPPPTPTP